VVHALVKDCPQSTAKELLRGIGLYQWRHYRIGGPKKVYDSPFRNNVPAAEPKFSDGWKKGCVRTMEERQLQLHSLTEHNTDPPDFVLVLPLTATRLMPVIPQPQ